MTPASHSVGALGEFQLIERFRARLASPPDGEVWSGDDAAVVRPGEGRLAITTDVLVEGIDFERSFASGSDVGWKALAVNVSDLAAVAARPRFAVVALSLPGTTPLDFVDELMDGLVAAADRWGLALVGGDVSEADRISIAVTAIGDVDRPVLRSGAQVGDAVCVTGTLGAAAAGLRVLRDEIDGAAARALARRQLRPEARVDEALELADRGATSLIDISDGFVADLTHLLDASGVGCAIDVDAIPVDPGIREIDLGVDPLELALTGGEDFELLVTMPAEGLTEVGFDLTRVGTITEAERTIGGRSLDAWTTKGWEHLRDR